MSSFGRVKRTLARVLFDEYLDLYILGVTALAFTVLGFLGIAGVKVLASITLALLAVLAYSQIRSRRHVADIARSQSHDPLSVLHESFPPELDDRRAAASSLLLIGVSLGTTVHGGSLAALRRMLESGGRLRVMVLDPTNDELVRAASLHRPAAIMPERPRRRIEATLDELEGLRDSTRGQLDIRVAPFVPQMNITAIDAGRPGRHARPAALRAPGTGRVGADSHPCSIGRQW